MVHTENNRNIILHKALYFTTQMIQLDNPNYQRSQAV